MSGFRAKALQALKRDGVGVLVTVAEERGSVPREAGAQMFVTVAGYLGSIGGGTLEWKAMAEAQTLLHRSVRDESHGAPPQPPSFPRRRESRLTASTEGRKQDSRLRGNDGAKNDVLRLYATHRRFVLGPDLGQCCGGQVQLRFEVHTDAMQLSDAITIDPPARCVALFGAGHVGRALVLVLAQSEFDVVWVDPRPDVFPAATPGNVTLHSGDPLAVLAGASLVIVMSHSHALDFDVVDAALRLESVERVLLIGSETKRASFLSKLRGAGHGEYRLKNLICPIGDAAIRSKKPYAIAISTAQQLLALDEALALSQTEAARLVRAK